MAVAAVAERAAVEDQVAVARALDEVAAVGEATFGARRRARAPRSPRRAVLARQQPAASASSCRVVAGVGVRQRGDRPVGAAAVRAKSQAARQPLVEAGRQRDAVAAAFSRAPTNERSAIRW